MTTGQIDKLVRQYLSCTGLKRNIISRIYNEDRRVGLRILARKITELSGKTIKPRDLLRIAGLTVKTSIQRFEDKEIITRIIRVEDVASGRRGKMGGKQGLQTSQFYQSV